MPLKTAIKTPCTSVCSLAPESGLCRGCGRSRDEIAGWIRMSDAERDRIMAVLPERLVKMEGIGA